MFFEKANKMDELNQKGKYGDDWRDYCHYNTPRKVKITVVKVTVHEELGVCHCHKLGDIFTCDFERVPGNICAAAWNSLWAQLPNKPVVFKIETFEE
jgi:hypothetical protein